MCCEGGFGRQGCHLFCDGIAILEHHLTKCIDVKGNYIVNSKRLTSFSNSAWISLRTF